MGEMDGELLSQVYKTTENSFAPSAPANSMASVDDGFPRYDDDDDDDDEDDEDNDDEFGAVEP